GGRWGAVRRKGGWRWRTIDESDLEQGDEKGKFDELVEDKGVKILIDPKALMHVIGTKMDFVDDKLRSEFIFINPNSKGQCGCGESFMTTSSAEAAKHDAELQHIGYLVGAALHLAEQIGHWMVLADVNCHCCQLLLSRGGHQMSAWN
ncbi:unnamed protein product, partial [Thlaspi arvense]